LNISADFKKLEKDCNLPSGSFVGFLDIGGMAKERNASSRRNASLVELCATVLRAHMIKNPAIRVSPHWSSRDLPPGFTEYATLDNYACHAIRVQLETWEVPKTLSATTPGGTAVDVLASDGHVIATGAIAFERPVKLNDVNVTASRSVVVIAAVLIPISRVYDYSFYLTRQNSSFT
jgi:hypothetical protein